MSDPSRGKTREIDPCPSEKIAFVDLVPGLEGFTGFVAGATAPANPVNPFKPVPVRAVGLFTGAMSIAHTAGGLRGRSASLRARLV